MSASMSASMSSKVLFMLVVGVCCACAQVTLSTVQGGVATPTGQLYSFDSVPLGSVAQTVFRLTNTGAASVYLTSLALDGPTSSTPPYPAYFSVVCKLSPDLCSSSSLQQLPVLIAAAGSLDFTIQFEPYQLGSPSATLTINAGNAVSVLLTGTGVAGLTVLWNQQPLGAGEVVSFGNVPLGTSQTIALSLANQTAGPVTVPAIPALAGSVFSLSGSALAAPTVAPGTSAELDIAFKPTLSGAQQATLTIGLLNYVLQGVGVAPPPLVFPDPSIQITLGTVASAQQGGLAISLASGSASVGTGTVVLTFQSAVTGVDDDPTIAFADGTRSATFSVIEGGTAGQFTGGPTVMFGTGTTAGTLTFTVTLGTKTVQSTVVIAPSAVVIDAAVAARNVACAASELYCTTVNVELQINGWDNTRSTSQVIFSFYDPSGNAIAPGNITVNAASAFDQYFSGSALGGVFGMHALFPVNGSSDQVVGAQVQITNASGSVETTKITF